MAGDGQCGGSAGATFNEEVAFTELSLLADIEWVDGSVIVHRAGLDFTTRALVVVEYNGAVGGLHNGGRTEAPSRWKWMEELGVPAAVQPHLSRGCWASRSASYFGQNT